jgi:radical SAM superfamily enzyme YgiQ (UPF0313 family)
MRIYLADLFHVKAAQHNPDTSPYTIPLGVAYLAATVNRRIPDLDVRLFRDPDRLLASACEEPPDLLGLSFTSWNMDVSRRVARWVKRSWPATVLVGGGPCVDEQDEQLLAFFAHLPEIDYLVPNEGEVGFVALVTHLLGGGRRGEGNIPGVAYLNPEGGLVRGQYRLPEVVPPEALARPNARQVFRLQMVPDPETLSQTGEVPSPYLDGTLDSFLEEGLIPIIQTMRGCPYRCEFCVSGTTLWNKPRGFSLERVEAEIEHALAKSRSKDLILTDENWGILGERDVELARFILRRYKKLGSPARLYYYTAKIVNDASREIVEMVSPIAWIGEFSMSFQSLNPETRKTIKRTNISLEKLASNVDWANERGIITSSEMIFGFPHETVDSFFTGIETLIDAGMHRVQIYPLQLFGGIDLASGSARQEYGFRTGFRLADNGYGAYLGGELIAAESEEVVVGTKWSGENGYFQVRRFAFFQLLLLGRGYFMEFFRLCKEAGIATTRLNRLLALEDFSACPALKAIMQDYNRDIRAELKPTHEEVVEAIAARLRKGEPIGGVKLNLVYLGKIFSNRAAVAELLNYIEQQVIDTAPEHPHIEVLRTYLREVLPHRVVLLDPSVRERASIETRFDYHRWQTGAYRSLAELLSPVPLHFEAVTPEVLRSNLRGFDDADPVALQGIFDRTPSEKLMRTIHCPVPQSLAG